jgi:hypothetical protein
MDSSTIHMNLDNYYEKDKFMIVWDGVSVATTNTGIVWPDYQGQRPNLTYDTFIYLEKDVEGPMVVTGGDGYIEGNPMSHYETTNYYTQNATYECDMNVITNTEGESNNAGIVFNVQDIRNGNCQFQGYYVGVDISSDQLMIGKCNYDWQQIESFDLPSWLTVYDRFNLKVVRDGSTITAYVDDVYVGSVVDNTYMQAGAMGVRAWNSDVVYYKLTASPVE